MRIGCLGLDAMGLPMTLNLAKAGHTVTGLDLSAASLEALEQAAGRRAATAS